MYPMRRLAFVFTCFVLLTPIRTARAESRDLPSRQLSLQPSDTIVFIDGTNTVRADRHAYLETLMTAAHAELELQYRNLAWEADTVFEQRRPLNFGDWQQQLERAGADVLFVQFGQQEALSGSGNIEEFAAAYRALLD